MSEGFSPKRLAEPGVAYLLSKVGAHSSQRWAERLEPLGLNPREMVILRMVAIERGRSQTSLGPALQVPPSRIVTLIDELERKRLLRREVNPSDRRAHALDLTTEGEKILGKLAEISRAHEAEITDGLSEAELVELRDSLRILDAQQGLAPGGHPKLGE